MAQKSQFFSVITLCFVLLLCGSASLCAAAEPQKLKGNVSQNEEIDTLESFGIKCVIHVATASSGKQTLFAEAVRPGSKAFYQGILQGDKIVGLVHKGDGFALNIERQGTPYQINFKALKATLDPVKTNPLQNGADNGRSKGDERATEEAKTELTPEEKDRILAQYDIEILIDTSGSMAEADDTDGYTKFEWCRLQVHDLSKRLAPFKKNMTITLFNKAWEVQEHCPPWKVEDVFNSAGLGGGTDLVHPLNECFDRILSALRAPGKSERKTLIIIITDGMPNIPKNPGVVNTAVINFTQELKDPDQVVLTMLQVGGDGEGQAFCKSLQGLDLQGAKYDIVHAITFPTLKQTGLANAIVDSIVDVMTERALRARVGKDKSKLGADGAIQALRHERERIEKQLLGK